MPPGDGGRQHLRQLEEQADQNGVRLLPHQRQLRDRRAGTAASTPAAQGADDSQLHALPCAGGHPAPTHATENTTPNNRFVAGTLVNLAYAIDNVTVDNTNTATIKFSIKTIPDNVLLNLGDNVITRPAIFSAASQPSFLFAYALPQDGIAAPVDYNNLGRTAGQPESLNILGLAITAKDNTSVHGEKGERVPGGRDHAGGRPPGVLHPDQRGGHERRRRTR